MKKFYWIFLVLLIIVCGSYLYLNNKVQNDSMGVGNGEEPAQDINTFLEEFPLYSGLNWTLDNAENNNIPVDEIEEIAKTIEGYEFVSYGHLESFNMPAKKWVSKKGEVDSNVLGDLITFYDNFLIENGWSKKITVGGRKFEVPIAEGRAGVGYWGYLKEVNSKIYAIAFSRGISNPDSDGPWNYTFSIYIGEGIEIAKKTDADWLVYKNSYGRELFRYPADFTVKEELSYNVDGSEVVYRGLSINPPESSSYSAEDGISVGAHRVSVCDDVPWVTKCAGGGKSSFTVTFTNSKNPKLLDIFDSIISSMEEYLQLE